MPQLLRIISMLDALETGQDVIAPLTSILRFINTTITIDDVKKCALSWKTSGTPTERLDILGLFLKALFSGRAPLSRVVSESIVPSGSRYRKSNIM